MDKLITKVCLIMLISLISLISFSRLIANDKHISVEPFAIIQEKKVESSATVTASDDITIKRTITFMGKNIYHVRLDIDKKQSLNRFGKVEEFIPNGFVASEIENSDGFFSFENNMVKILWMTMPDKTNISVSYEIVAESDTEKKPSIHGVVSYLNHDKSIQKEMLPSKFENHYNLVIEEEDEFADKADSTANDSEKETLAEQVDNNNDNSSNTKDNLVDKNSGNKSNSSNSGANNALIYKVQIAAVYKNKLNVKQFTKVRDITEEVYEYQYYNWFAYAIDNYNNYLDAKLKRDKLWAGKVKDAFVVPFKNGKRISIQEALLISNEKWVQ